MQSNNLMFHTKTKIIPLCFFLYVLKIIARMFKHIYIYIYIYKQIQIQIQIYKLFNNKFVKKNNEKIMNHSVNKLKNILFAF